MLRLSVLSPCRKEERSFGFRETGEERSRGIITTSLDTSRSRPSSFGLLVSFPSGDLFRRSATSTSFSFASAFPLPFPSFSCGAPPPLPSSPPSSVFSVVSPLLFVLLSDRRRMPLILATGSGLFAMTRPLRIVPVEKEELIVSFFHLSPCSVSPAR